MTGTGRVRGSGLTTQVIAALLPCARSGEDAPLDLEVCPSLVRAIQRALADLDTRIDELQRHKGALAAHLA